MSLPSLSDCRPRSRRYVAWALAAVIVLAGIAQSAHYHRTELARGTTDLHCLLCLFAGGSAAPSSIAQALRRTPRYCSYRFSLSSCCPPHHHPLHYGARGPPPG